MGVNYEGGYGQSIEAPLCFYFLFVLHLCASVGVQSFRNRLLVPELPILSELSIPLLLFGLYLGDLLSCSTPQAAGEQPAPLWTSSGLQETSAPCPEHPFCADLGVCRAAALIFFLLSMQHFIHSSTDFPQGAAIQVVGLCHTLCWSHCSCLEVAVSGTGQPQSHLTAAATVAACLLIQAS